MAELTSIPAARVPLLEQGSNVMSREWYRFLFSQFGQTGGGTTALSLSDLELAPASGGAGDDPHDDAQGLLAAPPRLLSPPRYASFASSVSQTLSAANTATAVTFDVVTAQQGIGLLTSSQVCPGLAGAYRVAVTVQMDKTSGGDNELWLWLRKSGADVPNTTMTGRIKGSDGEALLTVGLLVELGQEDYLEVMWASDSTNVILSATPVTAFSPAGPSALMRISQVDL